MLHAAPVTTAQIRPTEYLRCGELALKPATLALILALVCCGGFALRAYGLAAEGLSEDELNKLRAVETYRAHGLSSINGEHPMLMKALQSFSVVIAEGWNATGFAQAAPERNIRVEAALRMPGALLGALTSLLIYLVIAPLFGRRVALLAAALWAFDPAAIGFARIAKEDGFLTFFFLLANVFWMRAQRAAELKTGEPMWYVYAAAVAFGAMVASKYVPHVFVISVAYYNSFLGIGSTEWRIGKKRWLAFFAVMGVSFLLFNPTILLPGTWQEMRTFASERRIGHDSYEFMGTLYRNQMTLWLAGSPPSFYYAFILFKMPLLTVFASLVGLPLLFLKRIGDGRIFVFFWIYFWFLPFTLMGGKFIRYFTFALPVVIILAALGVDFLIRFATERFDVLKTSSYARVFVGAWVALLFIVPSIIASASVAPHYRLYTNRLGESVARAGEFFPHDEFYDARVRDAAATVARLAPPNARVASETPELMRFYAERAGRRDLNFLSISDQDARASLRAGDVVVTATGRKYFSNEQILNALAREATATETIKLAEAEAMRVYLLNEQTVVLLR